MTLVPQIYCNVTLSKYFSVVPIHLILTKQILFKMTPPSLLSIEWNGKTQGCSAHGIVTKAINKTASGLQGLGIAGLNGWGSNTP